MTEYQWKDVSVVGFDELMQALERADHKGYMPDAIKEEWEAFNWKPAQPQQEPVAWCTKNDLENMAKGFTQDVPARAMRVRQLYPKESIVLLYTSPPVQRTWVGLTDEQPAQQEPVAGKGKELAEQLKLCARNVAFAASGRVDMSSAAMQEMFALIDHVCVGFDSPSPQHKPLTLPEIVKLTQGLDLNGISWVDLVRAVEAAHGIKE